jgi:hypothetical protein
MNTSRKAKQTKLKWIRNRQLLDFNHPLTWFTIGVKNSGKSMFLEHVGTLYLSHGHGLFDWFGAIDNEGLGWLRSPYIEDRKVLLLRSKFVDVNCSFETKPAADFNLKDFESYDMIISPYSFYMDLGDQYQNAGLITRLLEQRGSWNRLVYTIVRESSNLFYSRLKVQPDQQTAKGEMIGLLRQMRHIGIALACDTLRFHSVDIDIRSLVDFTVFKALGISGLPRDLRFLYRFINPHSLQRAKQDRFALLCREGPIARGQFNGHSWHVAEKEAILGKLGIKIERGEIPDEAMDQGTFFTVSSQEHADIVKAYIEEGFGMRKIASKMKRSSATVKAHIDSHNAAVSRSGFCPSCRKVKGPYEEAKAVRQK